MISLQFNNNNDFLELFKTKLSEYTGSPYVVLTDSCTNALFLALTYYKNTRHHSPIITIPERTYISVPQSIIHAGFTPKFKDKSWVNSYQLGDTNIYDCAVGFERNMFVSGQIQCLSFQQKKRLGIGKGGAILTDDYNMYQILSRMAWDGRDPSLSVKDDENIIMGYHMNMIPDDACKGILLLNQLKDETNFNEYMNYPDISKYFLGAA
jgi:dTDP-4-amino-4,6-dideoxygalactose transaminase